MVFSSSMKLHPSSQHPLIEACLAGLEKNVERERHPQTLFLLLSYYRTKWRALQVGAGTGTPPPPEQLLLNRKILRLVKHTLSSVSSVRDHEMALLDEMLAACAREASNKSLELIFSSHLFYQNRQEKFIISLAGECQPFPFGSEVLLVSVHGAFSALSLSLHTVIYIFPSSY